MKRENIAIPISVIALLVSIASFWSGCEDKRHNRSIAFEQRRQEVRESIVRGAVLALQIDVLVRASLREVVNPGEHERFTETLGLVTRLREKIESLAWHIDGLEATPGMSEHLALEEMAGDLYEIDQKLQLLFERFTAQLDSLRRVAG